MGRYAIYDKIASGGMASVHFGRLTGAIGFTRTVAIKRLHPHLLEDPDFVKTMIDEARLSARIHHPNVVSTLDVVATASELLIVMEYVRGDSVARLARGDAPSGTKSVPLPIVSAIAAGALQGLHAAHEATSDLGTPLEIVHRDVSPQNILVGIDGTARIIDFGVAKAAGRLQTTSEGVLKGKLPYMAPEQLRGLPMTRRADVYAMGVVLWQLLTGRKLFQGEDQATLIGQILSNTRVAPSRYAPELPAALDALVMKALAVEPGDRYATAREMAEALVAIVPPPLPTEVGAWVQDVARESLARRAATLAEIESTSARVCASVEVVDRIPDVRIADGESETKEDVGTQVSSVSQATPGGSEGSRATRTRGVAFVTIAAAAVVAGGAMLVHRAAPNPPAAPAVSVSAASSAPEIASPAVPPEPSTPPAPTTSASAPPPVRASTPGRPPRTAPARNCNPNFYYDSAGQKIFKPECFSR